MARAGKYIKRRGASLQSLRRTVAALPRTVAHETAREVAPVIDRKLRSDFAGGRSAYGDARPPGVYGPVELRRTGALERALGFRAEGTVLRTAQLPRYARYMIGRFTILPSGRQAVPRQWATLIQRAVEVVVPRVVRS